MRQRAKVDRNQSEIVDAFRKAGCEVECLHTVGGGVADLLVYSRRTGLILVEVKDGMLPPSGRRLTFEQTLWHARFPVAVVTSVQDVVAIVNARSH